MTETIDVDSYMQIILFLKILLVFYKRLKEHIILIFDSVCAFSHQMNT